MNAMTSMSAFGRSAPMLLTRDRPEARPHRTSEKALLLRAKRANGLAKRLFDALGASLALALLAPLILAVAIAVAASGPGPIVYRHRRVGRYGQAFSCLKFRTMMADAPAVFAAYLDAQPDAAQEWADRQKLRDDPRVTRIGAFLRRWSLDELPQLVNVLAGDMSLIGPRPITRSELDRYGADRKYYLLVRPGMTGLWQVSGRSRLRFAQRVALDRRYLEGWTLRTDMAVLLRTGHALLRGDGAC
jgi:lipopolysaccharide/colanic/teichoic acid biosynthesis glycosyltransferase